MDFFEVVEKRRSIRRFRAKPVATKDLKRILKPDDWRLQVATVNHGTSS